MRTTPASDTPLSAPLIAKLKDLLKQATEERSHFYVGSCCREAIAELTALERTNAGLLAALEQARLALQAASRDIHENLQVAIYNLRGEARDGFKYGKPPTPPLLVHERGIARSEAVEKQCDEAISALTRVAPSPSVEEVAALESEFGVFPAKTMNEGAAIKAILAARPTSGEKDDK